MFFHLIDYTIFGACFGMILFLIGHHSGPIFGSYLLPFFCPIFGAISGAFFGLFSCILHLFSDFFLLFPYVSLFFAQILVQFSGAFFGLFSCILHLFSDFFFLIVILGHIFGLRLLMSVCFLHKFWCNFLVPLLAWFFAFCIFFAFLLSYSHSWPYFWLETRYL